MTPANKPFADPGLVTQATLRWMVYRRVST